MERDGAGIGLGVGGRRCEGGRELGGGDEALISGWIVLGGISYGALMERTERREHP